MIVKKIQLRNFRNYDQASIELSKNLNLIIGNNAQGKTNLLESLVYLSLTRSHRTNDDKNLIKDGEGFADIRCEYDDGMKRDIEAIIHNKGKTLLIYKQPVKKSSEFIGLLNVVLFSPDDLTIFSDAPKERRRVMNQEITKVSNQYLIALNRYQNRLRERNILLKNHQIDFKLLDTLDDELAKAQVTILKMRKEFVEKIGKELTINYINISESNSQLTIRYKSCLQELDDNEETTYHKLCNMYQETRKKDLEYHVTTAGCHHDDLIFEMNGRNIIDTASQGQKRMAMLAFKISSLKYIEEKKGTKPVLLLDDVLSELDTQRQKKLLEIVSSPYQCVITATDVPSFLERQEMKIFQIQDGKIMECVGGRK